MINTALYHIRELLANYNLETIASAEKFMRTVTPRWDSDRECLVIAHPDNGQELGIKLEDVNGSVTVHASLGEDSELILEMDDSYGDWSETCLVAYIDDDCGIPQMERTFFVSDDFTYDWR